MLRESSSSRESETQSDNPVESEDYFQSRKRSNNGVNSVRISIKSHDDETEIHEDFEISEKKSFKSNNEVNSVRVSIKNHDDETEIREDFETSKKRNISKEVDSDATPQKLERASGELTRESKSVETNDYVKSRKRSNNGVNSARVSIRSNEGRPEIQEDLETLVKRSISRKVDSNAELAKGKRVSGELTRESSMKRKTSKGSESQHENLVATDNDFQSRKKSNNGVNSVRVSIRSDERLEIQEDVESSKKRSISREVDLGAAFAKFKQGNGELPQESWIKRDTSNFIGDIIEFQEAHFVTGSSYEGSWDSLGMNGVGKYVMPNGTIYEGEIRDGMFHGQGSLYWPKNGRLDVLHYRGELKEYKYTFHDGLVYEENNWNYCKFPDRRFFESIKSGLRPGGRTLKTGKQPTKVLPFACYDTGDGVYDPKTMRITSYDDCKKILRLPSKNEYDWIIKNCRKSWSEPTGYRPDLNENWWKNPPELPYNIALSEDSPDPSWQRLTTFERDPDFLDSGSEKDSVQGESPVSPEVCLCGKYLILGVPCPCMLISGTSEVGEYETLKKSVEYDSHKFDQDDAGQFYDLSKSSSTASSRTESFVTGSSSSQSSPTGSTSVYEEIKSDSRVKLEEIYVTKKSKHSQIESEIPKIDLDFLSTISGEFSEDSFGDEALIKTRKRRKSTRASKAKQISEKMKRDEEQAQKVVEKEILQKSDGDESREKNDLTLDDVNENQTQQKFSIKSGDEIIRQTENPMEDEILSKFTEKNPAEKNSESVNENQAQQKFSVKSGDGIIRQTENPMEDEILSKFTEKNPAEKDPEPDNFMEEKILQKSTEEKLDVPKKIVDEKVVDKNGKEISKLRSDDQRKISLEKTDYETVPREKVSLITELEMANDRKSEMKLLPENIPDKYQVHPLTESKIIEKKSQPDLTSDTNTKENNDKIILTSLRMEEEIEENIDSKSDDQNVEDYHLEKLYEVQKSKMGDDKLAEEKIVMSEKLYEERKSKMGDDKLAEEKIVISPSEKTKQIKSQSKLDSVKKKSITELKEKFDKNNPKLKENPDDKLIISPSKFGNEVPKISESISTEKTSLLMTKKDSPAIYETGSKGKNSMSFKDNLPSLNKVHPSLASLVSTTEKKLSKEKEIIEIHKEKSQRKPKIESTKAEHVWRLSGVNQDYGPKTKIEDLLFHPALTAPRSENIEYVRKPCDFRVCKPTIREVGSTAPRCRCRKENPVEIPTKSVHSRTQQNINGKK